MNVGDDAVITWSPKMETIFSYRSVGLEHQTGTGLFYAQHVGTAIPHDGNAHECVRLIELANKQIVNPLSATAKQNATPTLP